MNCGKDIAIAALVRAFFKYYVTGVLETQTDSETSVSPNISTRKPFTPWHG